MFRLEIFLLLEFHKECIQENPTEFREFYYSRTRDQTRRHLHQKKVRKRIQESERSLSSQVPVNKLLPCLLLPCYIRIFVVRLRFNLCCKIPKHTARADSPDKS